MRQFLSFGWSLSLPVSAHLKPRKSGLSSTPLLGLSHLLNSAVIEEPCRRSAAVVITPMLGSSCRRAPPRIIGLL